ncbi:esterase-like activity of phytase family protein [Telmatospirillum sp. J64-1]|uniref:esterase-like activity of phytase family protein n=1 Tax=Telmatospirillum sp. J64-1 TaxID=2502183 RepID=UPI00163D759C|nr:esterase-like activity of phytase family protein [Telmatospirillum sp. J64-1]
MEIDRFFVISEIMRILRSALLLFLLSSAGCNLLSHPEGEISARPVPLESSQPERTILGALDYRGGLRLNSSLDGFGGFSGLSVREGRATVVSDRGRWFSFDLIHDDDGRLVDAAVLRGGDLHEPDGRPVQGRRGDAEEIQAEADGTWLVAFEQDHRLWRYGPDFAFLGEVPLPAELGPLLPSNAGLEAVVRLDDGRLLLIAEGSRSPEAEDVTPAWVGPDDGSDWRRLSYRAAPGYKPVGAARLPDGNLLVLERHFSLMGGFGSRIVLVESKKVSEGVVLQGKELALLRPPVVTDNFEGISVSSSGDGEVYLYIVSDDNFSPLQGNYLLYFSVTLKECCE